MSEDRRFSVKFTASAAKGYQALGNAAKRRANSALDALSIAPGIGMVYGPYYEAARLPYEVRVVYAGNHGIYYDYDNQKRIIYVRFIEDERRGPLKRLSTRIH
ncbi:MAG: hypothetical protein LKK35_06245 [Olsenella sp.]|jgi:mRNA-degrading endonuclease RelE of RelBE toxin-antitoxin system|nr:hypothetical protein [Olsenella sp.]MCI2122760.1 hypothetical protein [Olsenella sp.]MCI2126342.1 hypothetical protein [Olsenella sp.]MCI2156350.1 hypothetical protein [Olsenella sp.]MCI2159923.1 hypothetical protein [Olsenella sp.]